MRNTFSQIRQVFVSFPSALVTGALACTGIAIFALWYASNGSFSTLVPVDNAYIDLGEAFLHGQLSLLVEPDPELLALQDPYDPAQRIVSFLWDASLYEGKYYLYWGPVPALVFAMVEGITRIRPPGSLLVVICYMGLPIFLTIILYRIRRSFFPLAPGVSIGLGTLMAFMNLPMLFLLARPAIYETSILSGQFFLFLGILGWVIHVTGSGKAQWLLLAGLSWGLAIGSRYNLAISIGLYLAFAVTQILRGGDKSEVQRKLAFLLIPLTLCMVGLGIYNTARFGNPLETGMKYQLTLLAESEGRYSTSYILSNFFIYLSYPLTTSDSFPFVLSTLPSGSQFDEVVAGLFPSTPGLWLLALAIPAFILARKPKSTFQDVPTRKTLKVLFSMVMTAALLQFLYLTIFFFAAMRYMADFSLQLLLGLWILVWGVDEFIQPNKPLRVGFWLVISVLALWTVGIGFFGSFDIPPQTLRVSEPGFYNQIASFWNYWIKALGIY